MEIDIGDIILEETKDVEIDPIKLEDEIDIGPIRKEEEISLSPLELDTVKIVMDDYTKLKNKPSINDVELIDNKQLEDLNVNRLTNSDIEDLINSIII